MDINEENMGITSMMRWQKNDKGAVREQKRCYRKNNSLERLFFRVDRGNAFKLLSRPQTDVFIFSGLFYWSTISDACSIMFPDAEEKSRVTLSHPWPLTRIPPLRGCTLKGKGKRMERKSAVSLRIPGTWVCLSSQDELWFPVVLWEL